MRTNPSPYDRYQSYKTRLESRGISSELSHDVAWSLAFTGPRATEGQALVKAAYSFVLCRSDLAAQRDIAYSKQDRQDSKAEQEENDQAKS
ncbi:MAG: hypothetical protein HC816_21815 [Leptolyngbyaceae cyanobacterium RM1_1_2]|nr:hypothetical protein [Leptolyngbyaceae cyanobacterium RM1_1_2]